MIQLRIATHVDAPTILGFIKALAEYEREPDAVQTDEATLRSQLQSSVPPFECLIAEDEHAPIGFALFFHTYSTWRGRRGIWLEDLFVLPEARGRGAGRTLLARVAAIAHARGCARLEWSVLDWNQPALDFYRALGALPMDAWTTHRVTDEALENLASLDGVANA
ncbi:MAG: GNAT family N-acetyltransferase [Myxococcales bacterium]|nr:GNAT family N-acetyltransferase [Myxococcales bacterium]